KQRVVLFLERPHWETRVWIDDRCVGTNLSLSTPHEYDLGTLAPGQHTLTIRVDNRLIIDIGRDSHSVSDHTQGNWNGIVGQVLLRATPLLWLENVQVYPRLISASATIRGEIGNATGNSGSGSIAVRIHEAVERGSLANRPPDWMRVPVSWQANGGRF